MCFNVSLTARASEISHRFDALIGPGATFDKIYHSSAFSFPDHPLICSDMPGVIQKGVWGLIPPWATKGKDRSSIRIKTLNARSETLFDRPSFRNAIMNNRCLIPVTGFFEYRDVNGKKYPYHIRMKDSRIFSLAGIFEDVEDEGLRTFSIVTTEANDLMARIHNTKKRMPLILNRESEGEWIDGGKSKDRLERLMIPYEGLDLVAYPVTSKLSMKGEVTNVPEILDEEDYPELRFRELDEFI